MLHFMVGVGVFGLRGVCFYVLAFLSCVRLGIDSHYKAENAQILEKRNNICI